MALKESDELKIYKALKRNIDVQEIKKIYPNISESDLDMCITTNIYDFCDNANLKVRDAVLGLIDMRKLGEEVLVNIKENILDSLGYFSRVENECNSRFYKKQSQYEQECNFYENPFMVTRDAFNRQFDNLQFNSDEQLYAKTIFWSNCATKQLETIKKRIVDDIGDENGINGKKALFEMKKIENDCRLKIVDENYNLRDEFISLYKRYLEDDITKEELENDEVYNMLQSYLGTNSYEVKVTMDDIFKYFSISSNIQNMYKIKDAFLEKLISLFATLEKDDNPNDVLKVYQCDNNDKVSNLNRNINRKVLTVLVKGTNTPVKVHISSDYIEDIESAYDVKILDGEVPLYYRNVMFITYDEKQKKQIQNMNDSNVKMAFDWDVKEFVENQYNMCNDLDYISIKKDVKSR